MLSKKTQLYGVGVLVIITTLVNCIRSTLYLAGHARTNHFKDELAIMPALHAVEPETKGNSNGAGRSLSVATNSEEYERSLGISSSPEAEADSDPTVRDVVRKDDIIYQKSLQDFDTSPVVIEKYKLVFITLPKVACTTWKFFFRRVMGHDDWTNQDMIHWMPHNPNYNGLKYLYNYSIDEATEMMTSPEWTRAIFLREPKRRFLSAFLDKVYNGNGKHVRGRCCPKTKTCVPYTAQGFLELIHTCHDSHWVPQHYRLPPRLWKYVNFVGKFENVQEDANRLLQRIGAWEEYGSTGWGADGNLSIFQKGETTQTHVTNSQTKIWQWYTPALERKVEAFYAMDYANPIFNFTMQNLTQDFYIQSKDKLWARGAWDGAPIVIEKYKLIFFTMPRIGATQWKMLFRRIQGLGDWNVTSSGAGRTIILPHDPEHNGLNYLNDYDIGVASDMITGNDYTKAIFVRNPKDRFLSVYHELQYKNEKIESKCCPNQRGCSKQMSSFVRFLDLMQDCSSPNWDPQYLRIEERYWKHIDFIGHIENAQDDAKRLLEKVGAWEDYGASGWGPNGNQSMFTPTGHEADHVRMAIASYTPVVDRLVEKNYQVDYNNDLFQFPKTLWAITQT
jgi:hypothetical protein